jgi:hypothetical protein
MFGKNKNKFKVSLILTQPIRTKKGKIYGQTAEFDTYAEAERLFLQKTEELMDESPWMLFKNSIVAKNIIAVLRLE